jgi:beta-glucosidase-like glycosyl hydrolase
VSGLDRYCFPTISLQNFDRFNRALIRARGLAIGQENKAKGVNVALGPMMNMGRLAQGGRNWEGFGADPFLSGEAAYETILGLQAGGVQATAKHYINKLSFPEMPHNHWLTGQTPQRTRVETYSGVFQRR